MKSTKLVSGLVIATVILGAPFLQGCVSSSKVEGSSASVGQQLQDLDKARKDGLINDREYDRLRKAIIKKND